MRAIELFSCAGGMAMGFARAGIRFDCSFDRDENACESYAGNLGHRPIRIDVHDLLRLVRAGWRPADDLDLIVADPPCTPWSRAGKRAGLKDARDMLRPTVELIRLLEPRAYLIGNIPGLQDASSWPAVQDVLAELAGAYCVLDYAVFDCADFGVPQHRIRPFWFGHRGGRCIRWPEPTHRDPRLPVLAFDRRKPWVNCRDALADVPVQEIGTPIKLRWKRLDNPKHHRPSKPSSPCATITTNPNTDGALVAMCVSAKHPASRPDEPAYTITARDRGGTNGGSLLEWPWDRPATSVTTRDALGAPGHHEHSEQFGPNAVKLSERAATLIQGFPDGTRFAGKTKKARWAQLGQAMPPPMAEAVAKSIVEWFERAQDGDTRRAAHER